MAMAGNVWPVPCVVDRSRQSTNDGLALFGDLVGVGVLVAHHDEGFTVDGKLVAQTCVSDLQIVHCTIESVQSVSILRNLPSVPGNLLIIHIDARIVLGHSPVGRVDTVLQVRD